MGACIISDYETPRFRHHHLSLRSLHDFMPPKETPTSYSRKRQLSTEAEPATNPPLQPSTKRRKLEKPPRHRTPNSFWDNLSRQWLTPRALREFDRRTAQLPVPVAPALPDLRREDFSAQLKCFARHGGPSLSDIRAVRLNGIYLENPLTI